MSETKELRQVMLRLHSDEIDDLINSFREKITRLEEEMTEIRENKRIGEGAVTLFIQEDDFAPIQEDIKSIQTEIENYSQILKKLEEEKRTLYMTEITELYNILRQLEDERRSLEGRIMDVRTEMNHINDVLRLPSN